nr:histidine phosphatase family protein [Aquibacillus albus]
MIRHCHAEGQHKDSPLTKQGIKQSKRLSNFIEQSSFFIDRIITSPYLRARESIKPYAENNNLLIQIDHRLQERLLSEAPIDDWMDVLEKSFSDRDFRLPGGESSNDALSRSIQVVNELMQDESSENAAIVTHGNLLAILLGEFQEDFGYEHWKTITNPDVYMIEKSNAGFTVKRLWDNSI